MSTDELVKLKQAAEDARMIYCGIAAANTVGRTAAELVDLDLAYRRAAQKWQDAVSRYEKALNAVLSYEKS